MRYHGLDFIKFIAAIGIALHHFNQIFCYPQSNILPNLWLLVELFFMISGFLSMNSYEKTRSSSFHYYLVKKISRIYPMVFMVVISVVLIQLGYYVRTQSFWGSVGMQNISYWNIIVSCLLLFYGAVGNVDLPIIVAFWYLSVLIVCELIFYFIIRISIKYKKSVNYFFALMILIGLMCFTYSGVAKGIGSTDMLEIYLPEKPFMNSFMARGYCNFFFGCLLFECVRSLNKRTLYVFSIGGIILSVMPFFTGYSFLIDGWNYMLSVFTYPAIIIIFSQSKIINICMNNKIIHKLGEASFCIYLWHMVVIMIMGMLYQDGMIENQISARTVLCYISIIVILGCMMNYVEVLLYDIVKKKLLIFSEKLLER